MAIGSGLSAQLGFAEESEYGDFAMPTRFLPFEKEGLKLSIARDELGALLGGSNTVLRSDRWAEGARDVSGPINLKVLTKGFGLILKHMLGSLEVSTPAGGVNTRDHIATLADLFSKSLSFQVGRPDVNGIVHPFSYLGAKIDSWELSNSLNNFLELTLNIDGRDGDTGQELGAPSYASGARSLHWAGGSMTIESAPFKLKTIKIKGANGLGDKRYSLGSQLKDEPAHEKLHEITGEVEAEFTDLTAYNRFVNGTLVPITASWRGPLIEGTLYYQVQVSLPVCRFDGDTPQVDGPGRLNQKLPFKVLDDGTQPPISILYRTTDTAA